MIHVSSQSADLSLLRWYEYRRPFQASLAKIVECFVSLFEWIRLDACGYRCARDQV